MIYQPLENPPRHQKPFPILLKLTAGIKNDLSALGEFSEASKIISDP
jgi:hypothetical protein